MEYGSIKKKKPNYTKKSAKNGNVDAMDNR